MANLVVKQATSELNGLRPTSRGLSFEKRSVNSRERSRSCEPPARTRFKTPPRSAAESLKMSDGEVERVIVHGAKQNLPAMKQAFKTLDIFNNGTVTQGEFAQVLHSYCNITIAPHRLTKFFQKLGVNKDGTVSYARFITKYLINENTNGRKVTSPGSLSAKEEFESKLKSKLRGQYTSIVKAMKLFDYNRDGFIQKHELRRVIENFCFRMTDLQFERLWAKYDRVNNGSMMNYMDFLNDLGVTEFSLQEGVRSENGAKRSLVTHNFPGTPPTSPPLENYVEQTFKEKFLANYEAIYRAIMILDHRACGYVPLSEFKKIIVTYTVPMSDNLLHSLLKRCGITVSHRINYERFIDFYGKAQTNILWQPESMTTQEDIFNALQSHINSSFTSIKEAFLEFDYNKDGKISRSELRRIVEKFSFRLSEEDYAKFMSRVDPEHKGYISYHRFLEIFEKKGSVKYGHPNLKERNIPQQVSPPAIKTWSTVEEMLRNKIKDNWQSVSNAFINIDTNKDGHLSRKELRNLLERYCLPLTDDHFEMLWSQCDENNDGRIAFNEFLNKLGVDIISADLHGYSKKITDESEAREKFMKQDQHVRRDRGPAQITARQAVGILRNYVMQKSTDLRKIFVKFDSNSDGEISRIEFRKVLESLGLAISDREFDILCTDVGFSNETLLYNKFLKHFQGARIIPKHHAEDRARYEDTDENGTDVSFSAEEAEAKIKSKLQQTFSGLREAFYKFDENHDGEVSRQEFRSVLKLFMINMTDFQFDRLMAKFHFGQDQTLNYREFLKRFEQREHIESHGWLMGKRPAHSANDVGYVTAEQADEIIKIKATQKWEDISRAFRNFDEDGNGIVTKKELKNILYHYQLSLTQQEFDKLWNKYDTDRNGFVDYKEFIAKLGVEFSAGDTDGHSRRIIDESYDMTMPEFKNRYKEHEERAKKMTNYNPVNIERPITTDVDKKLKEVVLARFYKFVKALVEADVKRNGSISRSVLHKIINTNGFRISNDQMNQVWNTFPLNEDGTIQYKDFLSLYTNTKDAPERRNSPKPSSARIPQKFHTRVRSAPLAKPSALYGPFSPPGRRLSGGKSTPAVRPVSPIKILTPPGYAKEIEKRIKDKICEKWRDLENNFLEHDFFNSGVVTLQSFKDVLFDCNVPLTPDEIRIVGRKYEVGNTGSISYMEFLRSFLQDQVQDPNEGIVRSYRSKLQPTRIVYSPGKTTDQLLAVIARLRQQIRHDWKSMRRSFRALDQEGNGTCSTLAFRHILRKYNIELTEEEFYHLTTYYDKNVNGRIPYNKFIGAHLD